MSPTSNFLRPLIFISEREPKSVYFDDNVCVRVCVCVCIILGVHVHVFMVRCVPVCVCVLSQRVAFGVYRLSGVVKFYL